MFIELEYTKVIGHPSSKALFNLRTITRAFPNSDGTTELFFTDGGQVTLTASFVDFRRELLELTARESVADLFGR